MSDVYTGVLMNFLNSYLYMIIHCARRICVCEPAYVTEYTLSAKCIHPGQDNQILLYGYSLTVRIDCTYMPTYLSVQVYTRCVQMYKLQSSVEKPLKRDRFCEKLLV